MFIYYMVIAMDVTSCMHTLNGQLCVVQNGPVILHARFFFLKGVYPILVHIE